MRFIHLADLHIGKKLAGYSLLEDQAYIFKKIIKESRSFNPDAFLIAGDIYDRSVPSEDSVELYEWLITSLAEIAPVYIISGNHDSAKRLSLFSDFLQKADIHIVGDFTGDIVVKTLSLDEGPVKIYMLPYLAPAQARVILQRDDLSSYEDTVKAILDSVKLDDDCLNILLSHQFYLNHRADYDEMTEGSERPVVGGLDDIHAKLIEDFDYAALGHIHGMRELGSSRMRYPGTPLKYSINENDKYLNCVTLSKDDVKVKKVPLKPLRDVRTITGSHEQLMHSDSSEDYIFVNLTDEKAIPNVVKNLLKVFPNLLGVHFNYSDEFTGTREAQEKLLELDPVELLGEFFRAKGQQLDKEEEKIAIKIFEELESGGEK